MEINKNDIPLQAAVSAHNWTSMTPEVRGEQEQAAYFEHMTSFYSGLIAQAGNEHEREYLESAALRYREGYISRKLDHLRARSRCASTMVTGGSNFNVRRNEKANRSEHNKSLEFSKWIDRAQAAILKGLKTMRTRLEQMEKRDATPTAEKAFEGGIVRDNAEADRIQIIYKERPGPELYGKLKGRGFRWSPTAGAWQRYRTQNTRWAVEAITGVKI